MELRFLLIETDGFVKNECVNIADMHSKIFRANVDKIYSLGFEHEDIVEIAEQNCVTAYRNIAKEVQSSVFYYPLAYGPRKVLIESIEADLVIGHEFTVELVIYDDDGAQCCGRLKLNDYVDIKCHFTGKAELNFDNKSLPFCPLLTLVGKTKLCLKLSGEVRLTSDIKVIAELDEEGDL
jgi:hypothetical protein